ncbi:MAG: hypothetical protein Q8R47_06220 [Nanoarchaeota archaeon]|nr:hypothetical protein [Nanoarchaeota archaeon]
MSARIHFIGCVHGDPQGSERLWKALEYEKPDIITVEFNQDALEYVETEGIPLVLQKIDSLGFHPEVADFLKEKMGKPSFGATAARLYALQQGIPIHYVDHPSTISYTKSTIAAICNSSKEDFQYHLSSLASKRMIHSTDKKYLIYQSLFDKPFSDSEAEEKNQVERGAHLFDHRDTFMAHRIQDVVEAILPGAKDVHVGGLAHCLRDDQELRTLFSCLRHYSPTRATLKWYEGK